MRKALREMKNVVYQFSPIELKVREATNNDRFMVSAGQLAEIARATNDYTEYPALFSMLWKRLTDLEHVMHVQKALHLAEYLLRHGAERFVSDARRRARDIAALQKYKHYDEHNQDDAKEARARAKAVYALLMDDQLLAQERGKSARLASEGRLAGMGTYDDDDVPAAAAAAPRYAAAAQGRRYAEDVYGAEETAAPAAPVRRAPSAAPSATGPKSVVLRRRSIDEDPFENPVIPAVLSSGTPVKPRERAAPAAAGASASKRSAAPAPAHAAEEDEAEEDEEAAAKRAKKEKKKKKKEEEARRAAALAEEEARQQSKQQRSNGAAASSSSSSSSNAAGGGNSLATFDLASFAPDSSSHANGRGDIDILTGMQMGGRSGAGSGSNGDAAGGGGGDALLEDLFASATLTEEQVSSPLFYQQGNFNATGNPFQSPSPLGTGNGGGGGGEGHVSPIVSPTAQLVNLNNLRATVPRKQQQDASVDAGVSMSMMRSIQPLGTPVQAQSNVDPMHKRHSNVPSSIPLDYGQHQAPNAFMYPHLGPGGPHGPQMGYPQQQQAMGYPPHQMAPYGAYPPQAQAYAPMGVGYPHPHQQQHPGMQLWNDGGAGGMHAPQPMMAIMPPSSSGGMAVYGGGATDTSMRQAPNKHNQTGAIMFEVPQAQPRAVEPINYMQQQQQQPGGQQFYGQRSGAQHQAQHFTF